MEVSEVFLGFAEAESTRAVALAEGFMTTQAEFGNEPVRCVRKAGTGAAIVAEVHGGVQTVIRSSVYQCVSEACIRSSVRPLKSTLSEPSYWSRMQGTFSMCRTLCKQLHLHSTIQLSD